MAIQHTEQNFEKPATRSERQAERPHSSAVDAAWAPGTKVANLESPNTSRSFLPSIDMHGMHGKDGDSKSQSGDPKGSSQAANFANEQKIMDKLVGNGLTPAQAAGVVGNLVQESNADPSKHQLGGGPGYGLAQWGGSRLNDLKKFAAKEGKQISDLGAQVDFMLHELNTTEKSALNAVKNTMTASGAAAAFELGFERAGKPNTENRQDQAVRVLAQFEQRNSSGSELAMNKQIKPRNEASA